MAKFLLLTHIYPPAVDGGSKVISKIGEYLEKNGHQILIITSNCTSTDSFSQIKHSTIKHPPKIISLPIITFFHRSFKLLGKIFPNFRTFSKGPIFKYLPLKKIIDFKPDFILAGPLPTTIIIYAKFIQFFTKSKLIINASFHQNDADFHTPILLNILKKADYIWTLTNYETKYFHQKLSISKNKLLNLGNGVDKNFILKNYQPKNKKINNLLYIGSFAAHKNLKTLIIAFSLLPKNFQLTLAGQKTLHFPKIKQLIDSLPKNISTRIKLIYSFPNQKLTTLIDQSDILISPSLQESFGLVLIEAMSRSKPVIAADIPASSELIHQSQSGLTFSPLNAADLKHKILKLSSDPKLATKLGQNGCCYVTKHYTWNRIEEKLCQKLAI
jgi:glycosyltransferase involved in cell wall biosynthesis